MEELELTREAGYSKPAMDLGKEIGIIKEPSGKEYNYHSLYEALVKLRAVGGLKATGIELIKKEKYWLTAPNKAKPVLVTRHTKEFYEGVTKHKLEDGTSKKELEYQSTEY